MEKAKKEKIKIFKIKNRRGDAAVCKNHLTEGSNRLEALERMVKALKRRNKRTV